MEAIKLQMSLTSAVETLSFSCVAEKAVEVSISSPVPVPFLSCNDISWVINIPTASVLSLLIAQMTWVSI